MLHINLNFYYKCRYLVMYCLLLGGLVEASEPSVIKQLSSSISSFRNCLKKYYEDQAYKKVLQKKRYTQEKNTFNMPMNEASGIFNLPLESLNKSAKNDEMNLPCDIPKISIQKDSSMNLPFDMAPTLTPVKKDESGTLKKCLWYPNVALNVKTSLLRRLFVEGEVTDNYHSVSPILMDLMMRKGVLDSKYGKFGLYNSYDAYGLFYFLDSLNTRNFGAAIISCVPRKVSVLTQNSKKFSDVIFHIGFEKFKKNDRARLGVKHSNNILKDTMELDNYIGQEEKVKLWNIVLARNKKRENTSFFIDINNIEQAIPLKNMIDLYGEHYTKDIDINGKKDKLMVFPCPNSFFVTRDTFITGASLVEA